MAFNLNFTDNQQISANLINTIQQELGNNVNASTDFVNETPYAVDKLNQIREDIVTAGVAKGCGCILANGKIKIQAGICFFSNGMRIEVDTGGVELEPAAGKSYVYFYRSGANGVALPIVSPEAKTGTANNEYIPLAEVENEAVTDKRICCKSKIQLATDNYYREMNVTIPSFNAQYATIKVYELDLLGNTFRLVRSLIRSNISPEGALGVTHFEGDSAIAMGSFHVPYNNHFHFKKKGSILEFYFTPNIPGTFEGIQIDLLIL